MSKDNPTQDDIAYEKYVKGLEEEMDAILADYDEPDFEDQRDAEDERWLEEMIARVGPIFKELKISIEELTVGPKHDPYSRTVVHATAPDGSKVKFVSCALAGDDIYINSHHCTDGKQAVDIFTDLIGASPDDVIEYFYINDDDEPRLSYYE